MTSGTGSFEGAYRAALERYVDGGGEAALRAAYELGRSAVRDGLGLLELGAAHHRALADALSTGADAPTVVARAGDFYLEALASFEVLERLLRRERDAAAAQRRQAAVIRRLTAFLTDASIAADSAGSLEEVAQLVAEHAREILAARSCTVTLAGPDAERFVGVASDEHGGVPEPAAEAVALVGIEGRELGRIEVVPAGGGRLSELDDAVLQQLAQVVSAAVERARLYGERER